VKKIVSQAADRGSLKRQICDFDFRSRYGHLGEQYIECHDAVADDRRIKRGFPTGVGGDAATEPHKTGCWGYPEEEFSGTHMDLNASIFKAGETIRRGSTWIVEISAVSDLRPRGQWPQGHINADWTKPLSR